MELAPDALTPPTTFEGFDNGRDTAALCECVVVVFFDVVVDMVWVVVAAAKRTDPGVFGSAASLAAFSTNRGDRGVVGVEDTEERTERAAIFGVSMVNNIQKGGGLFQNYVCSYGSTYIVLEVGGSYAAYRSGPMVWLDCM
jgi:hypothetical protein